MQMAQTKTVTDRSGLYPLPVIEYMLTGHRMNSPEAKSIVNPTYAKGESVLPKKENSAGELAIRELGNAIPRIKAIAKQEKINMLSKDC